MLQALANEPSSAQETIDEQRLLFIRCYKYWYNETASFVMSLPRANEDLSLEGYFSLSIDSNDLFTLIRQFWTSR